MKLSIAKIITKKSSLEDIVFIGSGKKFLDFSISKIKKDHQKILFVSDEVIWSKYQKYFPKNFSEIVEKILILENPKADDKNLKKIEKAVKNCDLILALGSGTINDLCKFTSAQKNIPYAIFASAASMNGYLSKNASITIFGHKKTLPATLAIAVFCDLKILKSAPIKLTKAGIGDSLCFYSCWFDWYLSHQVLGTKFNQKPFDILRTEMEFFVKNYQKFSIRDEDFLKKLIKILMLSGWGMTISDGSYPASQSEHLISHAIEMKYPEISKKKLHGEMIAVTSLTASKLQSELLEKLPEFAKSLNNKPSFPKKDIESFFNAKIAAECEKEFLQKALAISQKKEVDWQNLKKDLLKIHFSQERLVEIFRYFKIATSSGFLGLSNLEYQACIANSKFIRNRFTCLDFF